MIISFVDLGPMAVAETEAYSLAFQPLYCNSFFFFFSGNCDQPLPGHKWTLSMQGL